MLDVGWSELLIIALVAMVVVGPKELPGLMRNIGNFIHKMKSMASTFQKQFEEAVREGELGKLKNEVEDVGREFSPERFMGGFDRRREEFDAFDAEAWNRDILMKEEMEGPYADVAFHDKDGFEPPFEPPFEDEFDSAAPADTPPDQIEADEPPGDKAGFDGRDDRSDDKQVGPSGGKRQS